MLDTKIYCNICNIFVTNFIFFHLLHVILYLKMYMYMSYVLIIKPTV